MLKSKTGLFTFHLFNESTRDQNQRQGELKLAETINFGPETIESEFVILGISEDIGPQMNDGFSGAKKGFGVFLQAFQTVQSNKFCSGENVGVLGEITQNIKFESINKNKGAVEELDDFILNVLTENISKRQKLIVIGGGHNNAFPLLKNLSILDTKRIHAVNIDPHADCRSIEYRHSGNPFSCAINEDVIHNYSIFGLHESYNNTYILDYLDRNGCYYKTFENWLDDPNLWWSEFENFGNTASNDKSYSLDIDLDAISFLPTSALTPSGFSIEEIRKMIRSLSSNVDFSILHLPEGAPETENEHRLYGKIISYFVLDFIKCQSKK